MMKTTVFRVFFVFFFLFRVYLLFVKISNFGPESGSSGKILNRPKVENTKF